MRSIAIVNQKGGCGKTTTAVNLSSCIAERGKKVLLVDCDPQSHASMGLGIDTDNLPRSTYDILMDSSVRISDAVQPVTESLHVTPSSVVLSAVEQQLAGQPDRENRLRQKIAICETEYDYLFVDCPPSVGLLTFNALVACKEALVVMEPSYYALHGAQKVIETIRMVREQLGMRKKVRVLLTLFDCRTNFNKRFIQDAKACFGPGMLFTVIRRSTRFKEAADLGIPVCSHDKKCGGATDYMQLAQEFMAMESQLHIDDFEAVAGNAGAKAPPGTVEWILSHPGPQILRGKVLFSLLAPEAKRVEVAGSFNRWGLEDAVPFTRKNDRLWVAAVDLRPGRHLYKFVVDGTWITDPANANIVAPNNDCVVEVPVQRLEPAEQPGITPGPELEAEA